MCVGGAVCDAGTYRGHAAPHVRPTVDCSHDVALAAEVSKGVDNANRKGVSPAGDTVDRRLRELWMNRLEVGF